MNNIKLIAVKELAGFFSSLTAFLFFGAFLAVTLFIFFWVETFFTRNIADVRPLFEWMPVLMIFLVPALTMRMWSEERRSGTIEFLLTAAATNLQLVLGKFAACMALIMIALALTTPIPVTVSFLGPLDWGPVIGGYIAALFLAAAYTAIGLSISARTDNQIVSLLLSVLVCGVFLLCGSDAVTSLFSNNIAELLRLIGTGARFQSITRGVIDFRDLYYYISVAGAFICLNVLELEQLRWSNNVSNVRHKTWFVLTGLCIANLIAGNLWIQQIALARVDLTEGQGYSISQATRNYLARLNEPLIIRGYFSKKSHPLLQPLVPRLRDLLKEYALAGNGKVRVEFVDPLEKPELEKEAAEKYGIKPVAFQTATKYQASLTNSYFDVLIKYGDQFQKLNWKELIEFKTRSENHVDVDLKNPEYDITSTIKKLLYSYQGTGNLFAGIEQPVVFTGYLSAEDHLPPPLVQMKRLLIQSLDNLKKQSEGKFSVDFQDPDAEGGKLAHKLESDYGFRPMALGLDSRPFWFYMTLKCGDQQVQVPLPQEIQKDSLDRSLQSGLKRFSKGFLKTIGICPPRGPSSPQLTLLRQKLSDTYTVEPAFLDQGTVPPAVDLLLVVAPEQLTNKQLFAVDQFLMKGGTVMLSTAPFDVNFDAGLGCKSVDSGLDKWLTAYGIDIQKKMVLDSQNFPLPIPVRRVVSGYAIEEMQLAPYPYFIDIRGSGIGKANGLTAGLNQVMIDFASPISVDKEKNNHRQVLEILHSSPESWTSDSKYVEPDYHTHQLGFPYTTDKGAKLLAVAVEGSFQSFFKDKKSPLVEEKNGKKDSPGEANSAKDKESVVSSLIGKSPDSSRIILFASNSFLSDRMLWMASHSINSQYTKPLELIQNAADWSVQDRDLLPIRGRGHFARTLKPMNQNFEMTFEYLNYGLAIGGLLVVWLVRREFRERTKKRFEKLLLSIQKNKAAEVRL